MRPDRHDALPRDLAPILGRLHAGSSRLRRWLAGLGPTGRWALAAAALTAVLALGYLVTPTSSTRSVWLYDGHVFTPSESARITRLLVSHQIEADTDRGRVRIAQAQLADALALIEKNSLEPRTVHDILDHPPSRPFLAPLDQEERLQKRSQENVLEALIGKVEGAPPAVVKIERPKPRGLSTATEAQVRVWLEVPGDQPLPSRTVEAIKNVLLGWVVDLKPEGLTILDSNGNYYLHAGNPALGERSQARVREEELRESILEALGMIEGVRVFVHIEAPPESPAPSEPAPRPEPSTVVVNQPLDTEEPNPPAPPKPHRPGKATVLVQVPISYYHNSVRALSAERSPSTAELSAVATRVQDTIQKAVDQVVPAEERGGLTIDKVLDPEALAAAEARAADRERAASSAMAWWGSRSMWLPAAGVTAVVAVALAAAGGRWLASRRRPVTQATVAGTTRRLRIDVGDDDAGPSEGVRELIRLDPAAAAGVLQRWIGAGGHA